MSKAITEAPELKPCPFCGGPAKTYHYNGTMQATCAGSYQECAGSDVGAPIAMWNSRPALSAGQAQQSVKALEWQEQKDSSGEISYWGHHEFGCYAVERDYFSAVPWELVAGGRVHGNYDTVEGAKAAAQSDYEARIRSALVPPAVPGEVERYAERLAVTLWEKHWKDDAPEWKPLTGDLIGILTQIDNMTAGLVRSSPPSTAVAGGEPVAWDSPEEWAIEQRAFHAAGRDDVPIDVQQLVAKLWSMYCHAAAPSATLTDAGKPE